MPFGMPRASGDTPPLFLLSRRRLKDAPRKWGYTDSSALMETDADGCPAQVGIHLRGVAVAVRPDGMPRASGDTPSLDSACKKIPKFR